MYIYLIVALFIDYISKTRSSSLPLLSELLVVFEPCVYLLNQENERERERERVRYPDELG